MAIYFEIVRGPGHGKLCRALTKRHTGSTVTFELRRWQEGAKAETFKVRVDMLKATDELGGLEWTLELRGTDDDKSSKYVGTYNTKTKTGRVSREEIRAATSDQAAAAA